MGAVMLHMHMHPACLHGRRIVRSWARLRGQRQQTAWVLCDFDHFVVRVSPWWTHRISNDRGDTLQPLQTPGKWRGSGVRSLRIHPWFDNRMLVLVKRPDCRTMDKAQMECPHDLMLNLVR